MGVLGFAAPILRQGVGTMGFVISPLKVDYQCLRPGDRLVSQEHGL